MDFVDSEEIRQLILLAKREDVGSGDLSSGLLPNPQAPAVFSLLAKEPGVFAGRAIVEPILREYDPTMEVQWSGDTDDGYQIVDVPTELARLKGPLASVLTAERVLLNFLQRLCGVATITRRFVDAVADTPAKIYDTRKTIPGWRTLDKYAVRCGGGLNHRMGLYDAVLIKDNHLAGVPTERLSAALFDLLNRLDRGKAKPAFVEVEADNLQQVEAILDVVGIDVVLLDNFNTDDLRRAVELRDGLGLRERVALEASGGVTLATVPAIAATGVDRISVGAITHSAAAIDLSLERCEC